MDTLQERLNRIKAGMDESIHQSSIKAGTADLNTAAMTAQLNTITIVLLEVLKELSEQTRELSEMRREAPGWKPPYQGSYS